MRVDHHIPGPHKVEDTVQAMIYYAKKDQSSPSVISLTESITGRLMDNRSKMVAIMNWIILNMKYVKDEPEAARLFGVKESDNYEMVKSPEITIQSKRYDCDCIATLIASMLLHIGIPVRFVVVGFIGKTYQDEPFEHVYVTGFDGIEWMILDPVSHPNEQQMLEDTNFARIYDI